MYSEMVAKATQHVALRTTHSMETCEHDTKPPLTLGGFVIHTLSTMKCRTAV